MGAEADIQGIGRVGRRRRWPCVRWRRRLPAEPRHSPTSRAPSLDYLGTVRGRLGWLVRRPTLLRLWRGRSRLWRRKVTPICGSSYFQSRHRLATLGLGSGHSSTDTRVRLDGWRRPRMDVLAELVGQGGISLLRSRLRERLGWGIIAGNVDSGRALSPTRPHAASMVTSSAPASTITSTGASAPVVGQILIDVRQTESGLSKMESPAEMAGLSIF